MPVSTDLTNTTLADLKGPIQHSNVQKTLRYDSLVKRGKVSSDKGTLIERSIMGGSPYSGSGIFSGGETLNLGRVEQTHKIQLQTHRLVVPFFIPNLDLVQNDGKLGAIKLLDTYVKAVNDLIPADIDRFLFSGVSNGFVFSTASLQGWNTWNGQKTWAMGKVGVTQGLMEFAATTSQNDTTQNLAKSSSYNYVNQYGEVTTYATDGRKKIKKIIRECGQWNPTDMSAGPDIAFADYDSFALIEEEDEAKVRLVHTQDKVDSSGNLLELYIGATKIVAAKNLIPSDFTGAAAEGIIYFQTSEGVEWVWYEKPTMSNFTDQIANQDGISAKLTMMGAPLITGMNTQGVLVGTARS